MKKLILLSILLIIGCEEPAIEGCMDESACNYSAIFEKADNSMCMELDCAGVCGGTCTVCECAGVCGLLNEGDAVKDIDENCYETVLIGEQLWMQENLKTTKYKNGDEIPSDLSGDEWALIESGAYSVYDDESTNADIYGNLYNWYTVDDERGLCMEGWHVPTKQEWFTLMIFLDADADSNSLYPQSQIAGGMMKSTGTIEGGDGLWLSPNEGATNESYFSAIPEGVRLKNNDSQGVYLGGSTYSGIGRYCFYWSQTNNHGTSAFGTSLSSTTSDFGVAADQKPYGKAIRCLRD